MNMIYADIVESPVLSLNVEGSRWFSNYFKNESHTLLAFEIKQFLGPF